MRNFIMFVLFYLFIQQSDAYADGCECVPEPYNHSIVNDASFNQPWFVALYMSNDSKDPLQDYFCNGAIISPWHVLTAMKCVKYRK